MRGGIMAGIGPDGREAPLRATAEGALAVDPAPEGLREAQLETNRLLRKLIAGLELWTGGEFPEAE